MTSSSHKWLTVDKSGQLVVSTSSVEPVLSSRPVTESVNLISIFGAARQGKSFLMNLLSGDEQMFQISNSRAPCTQGADLSDRFLGLGDFAEVQPKVDGFVPPDQDVAVGFTDLEGQGDQDISYDAKLVTPLLMSSSAVVFNWKGGLLKDQILDMLAVFARAAQQIEQSSVAPDGNVFGHLHIVFRDWNFREKEDSGAVLDELFTEEQGWTDTIMKQNMARAIVKKAFKSVNVWLFPPPVENTEDLSKELTFSDLQASFVNKLAGLRAKLCEQLREPTTFAGQRLNGKRIFNLVPQLVDILNDGDAILPSSVFKSMLDTEVNELVQVVGDKFHKQVDALVEDPEAVARTTPEELYQQAKSLMETFVADFAESACVQSIAVADRQKKTDLLKQSMETVCSRAVEQHTAKHEMYAVECGNVAIHDLKAAFSQAVRVELPKPDRDIEHAYQSAHESVVQALTEKIRVDGLRHAQVQRLDQAGQDEVAAIKAENRANMDTLVATATLHVGNAVKLLREDLRDLQHNLSTVKSRETLDTAISDAASTVVAGMKAQLQEALSERAFAMVDFGKHEKELESIATMYTDAIGYCFDLYQDLQSAKVKITSLETEREKLQTENADVNASLAEEQRALELTQHKLQVAQDKLEDAEQQVEDERDRTEDRFKQQQELIDQLKVGVEQTVAAEKATLYQYIGLLLMIVISLVLRSFSS